MAKKKNIDDEILGGGKEGEKDNKEMDMESIRKLINKKAGEKLAYNLENEDPSSVKGWIPTGSRWLDSIIARGMRAGIPEGKVIEIAGLEGSGKSYIAAQIAANAIKKGIKVAYFDSESAIDKNFWERIGIDINEIIYLQAITTEFVFETIETIISLGQPFLFIWDSLANTATKKRLEIEGYNPQDLIAMQSRILSEGFKKLTIPLANSNSTFLVLNQLKYKIPAPQYGSPYTVPGGKALNFAASLRIWLTASKSNTDGFIREGNRKDGDILGTSVTARIEKSRFGTYGRESWWDILWVGDDISIQDKKSWFEVVKRSENLKGGGAGWWTLVMEDGTEEKFQGESGFLEKIKNNEVFENRVIQLMDEILIK